MRLLVEHTDLELSALFSNELEVNVIYIIELRWQLLYCPNLWIDSLQKNRSYHRIKVKKLGELS